MEKDVSSCSSCNTSQPNQDESGPEPESLTEMIRAFSVVLKNLIDSKSSILQRKTMTKEGSDISYDKPVIMCSDIKRQFVQNILKYLNTGTRDELMELKGINDKRVGKIMRYREQGNSFKTLDDLKYIMAGPEIERWMKEIGKESLR